MGGGQHLFYEKGSCDIHFIHLACTRCPFIKQKTHMASPPNELAQIDVLILMVHNSPWFGAPSDVSFSLDFY